MQGTKINGYMLQHLLGIGGMAEVWYADNKIGKKAAVKILLPRFCADESIVARFENEAKVMVELEHPNIRQVYDYDNVDGRPCIIMEYLEGDDLKSLMKQGHRFTDEELVKWWNQMVVALNYTHALGIVHRDIKPSNIFIDKHGNVRLLDFGIAKNSENGTGTLTGSTLGTRIYMSPEQVKDPKRVDYRTDLYSLAVTFVHLLTGKAPYDSTTSSDFEIQLSIVSKSLDLSGMPQLWQEFLLPYLEKDPGKRPKLWPFETMNDTPRNIDNREVPNDDETFVGEIQPREIFSLHRKTDNYVLGSSVNSRVDVSQARMNAAQERAKANSMSINFTVNGVGFSMIKVEGGTFLMDASNGDLFRSPDKIKNYDSDAWKDERPVHSVSLSSYFLAETEVTQVLWNAVMGNRPNKYGGWEGKYGLGDDYPAYYICWDDTQDFVKKLNELTGKQFRLPTEAEWEYVARGGRCLSGSKYSGDNQIDSIGWCAVNSDGHSHPVKQKKPNALGLYDMSGNVWEWCQDVYGSYGLFPQTNPCILSSDTSNRVLRGGSWRDEARSCRVSARCLYSANGRYNGYGFRLALDN